jgi:hypothetical protein
MASSEKIKKCTHSVVHSLSLLNYLENLGCAEKIYSIFLSTIFVRNILRVYKCPASYAWDEGGNELECTNKFD